MTLSQGKSVGLTDMEEGFYWVRDRYSTDSNVPYMEIARLSAGMWWFTRTEDNEIATLFNDPKYVQVIDGPLRIPYELETAR